MTATTRPAPAPRPGSPPSPCPPPRVAVVGCGYWGKNLVRNYHELGALAAVADADPGRARGYAEAAGVAALGFEEALADPGIDAVVIATPAEMHAAMTARANGRRTVPQIFIGDTHVGGFTDLHALDRAGELDRLLDGKVSA